jgi:type I restriction enzyme, S subunit
VTPKLRFPEFAGDWHGARLGDFFSFKNGVNADRSMYGSGRKFINVMDVIADAPITYDAIIGSVEISDHEFEKNKVVYGDVLFQRSSETREEVGQSNIYVDQRPATFGGFVIRGRPKHDINPHYFNALLKTATVRKDMTSRSGGSTRYNIGQESLEAVAVCVAPTLAEQGRIAEFFVTVDARIGLLRQRRVALEQYKKGVTQRLFAPTLRFKRDDGTDFPDWTPGTLGEVFSERQERGNADAMLLTVSQTAGIVPFDETVRRDNSSDDKSVYKWVSAGDIAYNSMRMWQGASGLAKLSGIVSPAYTVLVPKDGQDARYWSFAFKTSRLIQLFTRYSQGLTSDTWNLKYPALSRISVNIPHFDEQQKIADFLCALDNKITAVAAKIQAMQAFKKGLLQQMFV